MEINLYKDIKPTWDILPFDEETEKIPTKSNSYSWNNNPLDRDIAYFFRGKEFGRGIYFLPKTGVIADTQREVYGNELTELLHGRVTGRYSAENGERKCIRPFVFASIIGESFVFRRFETIVSCKKMQTGKYIGKAIYGRETCRYVFSKSGLIIENRDRSRVFSKVEKIMEEKLYDTMKDVNWVYLSEMQWAFSRDVKIPHKSEIVKALSHVKKPHPPFSFDVFCEIFSKAVDNKGIAEDTPPKIVNELYGRGLRSNTAVRIDKDLVVITGVRECEYLDYHEETRTYFDTSRAYFFSKNALTGKWSSSDVRDHIANSTQVRYRVVDKDILDNTCMERVSEHSVIAGYPREKKINLGSLLSQVGFLSAEQAAKIDDRLFNVILECIYSGRLKHGEESLSELLGLTGAQIKFLKDIRLPRDLEDFGKCMKEDGFIDAFPDVKKRIFAVCFYLEGHDYWTDRDELSKEEVFEAAKTLNSLEKTDSSKREHLKREYRDYLRMRRNYKLYVRRMRDDDPLRQEIEEFGDPPVNLKPSKISDCHNKIGRIAEVISCSNQIEQYSAAIEERYKNEAKKREYTNGKYSILMPQNAFEIILEGRELEHCVGRAGYIGAMAVNHCTILFLRDNNKKDKPLITIEERDGEIKQCYGFKDSYNHNIEIRDFIQEYASIHKLTINATIYKEA